MRTAIHPTQLHFHELASHFLELSSSGRLRRFGLPMTDEQIVAYVESLLASPESVFVVAEQDRQISGVLHLESMGCGVTLGLSVSAGARNLGIGTLLLRRAQLLARALGIRTLFVRNLNLNGALQRLALKLGMSIASAPGTLSPSFELPALSDRDAGDEGLGAKITLADDSLRSQWNGVSPDVSLLDLPEPVLS